MAELPVIEPAAAAPSQEPTAPQNAPPQAPVAPPEAGAVPPLSPGLLKIPAFQALLAGVPPAFSMSLKGSDDRDEVKLVTENAPALQKAGMGFYQSLNKEFGVMFNALRIHPADLLAADKAGKLLQVAPDFDKVNHEVSKLGKDHPALTATPATAYAAPASAGSPPQVASGKYLPPMAASVARKLLQQRIKNLTPSAPTGGPLPGAGTLANQVATGVV